jgi:hypothetical protein
VLLCRLTEPLDQVEPICYNSTHIGCPAHLVPVALVATTIRASFWLTAGFFTPAHTDGLGRDLGIFSF